MKRFKAFLMSLVLVTCIFGSKGSANAASYSTGKAIIPHWYQSYSTATYVSFSNITDNPINVTVTFYYSDGSIVTDDNNRQTGGLIGESTLLNYNDQLSDSSVTFTLNAHCTGGITLPINQNGLSDSIYHGYGVVQWQQNGNALYGLIAHIQRNCVKTDGMTSMSLDINGGLPF